MFNQLNKLRDIDECEQHKYATNPARGFHSDLLAELHNASALAGNCGVKLSSLLRLGSNLAINWPHRPEVGSHGYLRTFCK